MQRSPRRNAVKRVQGYPVLLLVYCLSLLATLLAIVSLHYLRCDINDHLADLPLISGSNLIKIYKFICVIYVDVHRILILKYISYEANDNVQGRIESFKIQHFLQPDSCTIKLSCHSQPVLDQDNQN